MKENLKFGLTAIMRLLFWLWIVLLAFVGTDFLLVTGYEYAMDKELCELEGLAGLKGVDEKRFGEPLSKSRMFGVADPTCGVEHIAVVNDYRAGTVYRNEEGKIVAVARPDYGLGRGMAELNIFGVTIYQKYITYEEASPFRYLLRKLQFLLICVAAGVPILFAKNRICDMARKK